MTILEEKRINNIDQDEVTIRLGDIIQFIKDQRRKILIGGLAGLVAGLLYVSSKPNVYKVEVTVMPEYQGRTGSGLGSVSAFAGLGLDNTSSPDAIRPDLYPNVLQSVPFALHLLSQQVYSKKLNEKLTLQEFIRKISTPGLFDKIKAFFTIDTNDELTVSTTRKNNADAIQLTNEQDGLVKAVQGSVGSVYDKKTGILTITATEPDPLVAASIARLSLDYLTNYISSYRTDKARGRVKFLNQRVLEAKQRYQTAEYTLSDYRDRNRSLYLNTAKLDEQRLQADYLLEQSVYNDLAKQLEQAKIKVQEETPTFKILEPPAVPLHKSGPKRTMLTLGFAVVGIVISLAISLVRHIMSRHQL